jgi:hypothetical protein
MAEKPGEKVAVGHDVECPKCGHKFWHQIGHAIKGAAVGTIEAVGNIIAKGANLGGDS